MQYKIVFSDIDGTLLTSDMRISESSKQAVQELESRGIPFVLVSARMPSGILPLRKILNIRTPIVCYSGALVLGADEEVILSVGIPGDSAVCLEDYLQREYPQISCSVYGGHSWLVEDMRDPWVEQERAITSSVPRQGSAREAAGHGEAVHKFLCMGAPEQIARLGDAVKERFPLLSVYRSKDTYLEIMDGGASKAAAIRKICETYHIPAEASVSFGDNYNDINMLTATGYSFAMGNAPDEVKFWAKETVPDNDSDGIAAGLERLGIIGRY